MPSYISTFFSGSIDPFWPHFILLGGAIIGGSAVGFGIIMESEKWSLATIVVVIGVVTEAIFTILLFLFDEGISSAQKSTIEAQRSKIIVLEKIIVPRHWYGVANGAYLGSPTATDLFHSMMLDSELTKFSKVSASIQSIPEYEAKRLAHEVSYGLRLAGWATKSLEDDETLPEGVHLSTRPDHDNAWQAAEVLARSFSSRGIEAESLKARMHLENKEMPAGVVLISIGAKPAFLTLGKMAADEYRAAHPGEK
jgi:hypothetical protein